MSVFINSYTDKNGNLKKEYKNLRFIDSYKLMLPPLSKLVKYLPEEKIFLLENYFEELGYSAEQIALLKQKGFYPYSYLSGVENIRETRLPLRKMWSNTLQ